MTSRDAVLMALRQTGPQSVDGLVDLLYPYRLQGMARAPKREVVRELLGWLEDDGLVESECVATSPIGE